MEVVDLIPILYNADETDFNNNGIGMLIESISCIVTEQRNGSFELELEYPVQGIWLNELIEQRIILAKPNDHDEDHLFRIYEVAKNLEETSIVVFASTITNDLGANLVNFAEVKDVSAQFALDAIKNNLVYPTNFNFISDIEHVTSSSWNNLNPLSCIAGSEGSVLDNWGGELKRTNDTIYVYARRGTDDVMTLRPGKGLAGLRQTISTKGLITCILPYVSYTENDETFIVKGTIVDSPNVSSYPIRYLQAIDFTQIGDVFPEPRDPEETPWTKEEYQLVIIENLNLAAANYFTNRNPECDNPKVTLEVDLIQLSDSSEYKNYKGMEALSLTDTITVWVEKFNIDVTLKITEIQYNSLIEQVTKIVAGNAKYNIYEDMAKSYSDSTDKLKEYIKTVENGIYNTIRVTADGKNNIFSGYTEPNSSLSKVDDIWYKPVADGEIEMYRYDGTAWQIAVGNASKLVIGEIDARKINLIYLNANNITTGTILGAHGAWNLNTGEFNLGSADSDAALSWDGTTLYINGKDIDLSSNNSINLKFSQIGGTNLIRYGANGISHYSNDASVYPIGTRMMTDYQSVKLIAPASGTVLSTYTSIFYDTIVGEQYTISVDVRCGLTGLKIAVFGGAEKALPSPSVWKRIYHTFTATATSTRLMGFTSSNLGVERWLDYKNIKVEKGSVATDWSPHPSELTGATYSFDGDKFKIGGFSGDSVEHTNSLSKYTHSDGSYTQIGVNGMERFVSGTGQKYHYLVHAMAFVQGSANTARWIQLPDEFKGKQFSIHLAIADSIDAESTRNAIQRFVVTTDPANEIDYTNARVPIIAYKKVVDMVSPFTSLINTVQGLLLAIY